MEITTISILYNYQTSIIDLRSELKTGSLSNECDNSQSISSGISGGAVKVLLYFSDDEV